MKKTKRIMVRVLEPENFEKNRQALLRFESQMVELGGIKGHLTNSKVLQLMSRTCLSVWGDGKDLYMCSQQRTFEMITRLVVTAVDENISEAVRVLADWLELKITYSREGSNFKFRYEKPGFGIKELVIPMRRPETPNQRPVQ